MTCYDPRTGYYSAQVNPETGVRGIVFDKRKSHTGVPIRFPCGKCIGCLKEKAFSWKVRCVHEMRMFSESAFVTLTYDQECLPANASLEKRAVQLFMKRLRVQRQIGVRFFACGEYGEQTLRPHYHILLFNVAFPDRKFFKKSGEHDLFRSDELASLWKFGDHYIGDVSVESCGYVVGYMCKSVTRVPDFYSVREPEFRLMSRRPGIGRFWFDKFGDECLRHDNCVVDNREVGLPRYYDKLMKRADELRLLELKKRRRARVMTASSREERSHSRRLTKEKLDGLLLQRFVREKT